MSIRVFCICFFMAFAAPRAWAQKTDPAIDTSLADYDLLFDELDSFLDSIMRPRSFAIVNFGLTSNYFTYNGSNAKALKKWVLAPSASYYHKSGLGINAGTSIIKEDPKLNAYQSTVTASYDWVTSKKMIAGASYTRYFTKDSLNFYTSPLQNLLYAYFNYRKAWLRPSIALSYGWGSRSAYSEREEKIQSIRLRRSGYTRINTTESLYDFNLTTSVRHDFYWLNLLSKKDFIRLTPQLSFVSGTQKFGFNQTSNTYGTARVTGNNILFNSENVNLDDQLYFQPISLTAFLKTEYSNGKFFIQPQLVVDYYFPAATNRFSTVFLANAGLIF